MAAGLSTWIDFNIVAPSLVTVIALFWDGSPILYKILSIPFGPNVVFTKSATAMAPTNACYKKINLDILIINLID